MSMAARAAGLLRARPGRLRVGPIGVDVSLEAVHLVQLQAGADDTPGVRAMASLPLEMGRQELLVNPMQFRAHIKRAIALSDFQGREAVIALPSAMFRTMSVNYPASANRELESAALVKVLRNRLDGDIGDYVIDYLPVKSRSQGDERLALVAVSDRRQVIDFLEVARKARFTVNALEIGPIAVGRLIGSLSRDQASRNVLVINSGRQASYLTLMSGTDLLFDQELSFGEERLVSKAADALDMKPALVRDLILRTGVKPRHSSSQGVTSDDADLVNTLSEILKPQFLKLVEEIKRVCMYAAAETRGGSVTRIYLLGSIARWPGADLMLSALTDMDVALIPDPLSAFGSVDDTRVDKASGAAELAVATGAALRGMVQHG